MDVSSEDVIIINPAQQNENEQIQRPLNKQKDKNVGGRPLGTIWIHFERKEALSPGKFGAECKYCSKVWKRGETPVLEEHLANHCPMFTDNQVRNRQIIFATKMLTSQDLGFYRHLSTTALHAEKTP